MLNIINSFQNKDGYSNPLFQKMYTTNNSKINNEQQKEVQKNSISNYTNENKDLNNDLNQENNKFIINEKANQIELITIIKKDEEDLKNISLCIKIQNYFDDKNIISIEVTDNDDPLLLYYLKIDEEDYQRLKKEQSLFIEFKNFSDYIYKMLNNCLKENFNCFIIINKNDDATMIIEEQTQFRKLNHLTLKLNSLSKKELKNHINKIMNEYKEKYEKELIKNKELIENCDNLKKEKNLLEADFEKLKLENNHKNEEILNEKNNELNILKENNQQKDEEINKLKLNLDNLKNDITKVNLENSSIQKSYKELEDKFNKINIELEKKNKIISEISISNEELNKQISDMKIKLDELENKNNELDKEKEKNESIIKNLRLINVKFENKLKLSINEINKANDIIEKFQNELKNQKAKIKSLKNEIKEKNNLINNNQIILDNKENEINDLKKQNDEKEEEIILLKENSKINEIKNDFEIIENLKTESIINNDNCDKDDANNTKFENQADKDNNNFNQSNSDYNPSYFFTFYNNIQVNSTRQSNNKKNKFNQFNKIDIDNLINNEKNQNQNQNQEIKTNEFNFENLGINNINSYQFREIKGSYFNEHPKRKDYFSNLPYKFNKSGLNISNQNQ